MAQSKATELQQAIDETIDENSRKLDGMIQRLKDSNHLDIPTLEVEGIGALTPIQYASFTLNTSALTKLLQAGANPSVTIGVIPRIEDNKIQLENGRIVNNPAFFSHNLSSLGLVLLRSVYQHGESNAMTTSDDIVKTIRVLLPHIEEIRSSTHFPPFDDFGPAETPLRGLEALSAAFRAGIDLNFALHHMSKTPHPNMLDASQALSYIVSKLIISIFQNPKNELTNYNLHETAISIVEGFIPIILERIDANQIKFSTPAQKEKFTDFLNDKKEVIMNAVRKAVHGNTASAETDIAGGNTYHTNDKDEASSNEDKPATTLPPTTEEGNPIAATVERLMQQLKEKLTEEQSLRDTVGQIEQQHYLAATQLAAMNAEKEVLAQRLQRLEEQNLQLQEALMTAQQMLESRSQATSSETRGATDSISDTHQEYRSETAEKKLQQLQLEQSKLQNEKAELQAQERALELLAMGNSREAKELAAEKVKLEKERAELAKAQEESEVLAHEQSDGIAAQRAKLQQEFQQLQQAQEQLLKEREEFEQMKKVFMQDHGDSSTSNPVDFSGHHKEERHEE